MEELRSLVRKWNLHHKRHFWRENPTKDDIVTALIRHIFLVKKAHTYIEKKRLVSAGIRGKRTPQHYIGGPIAPGSPATSAKRVFPFGTCAVGDLLPQGEGALPRIRPTTSSHTSDTSHEARIVYMSRWRQDGLYDDEIPRTDAVDPAWFDHDQHVSCPESNHGVMSKSLETSEDRKEDEHKLQAQLKCALAFLNMTMRHQVR